MPLKRKIPIDLEHLCSAFEDDRSVLEYYLDLETGAILHTSEWDPEEAPLRIEQLEEECDRYLPIPYLTSDESYQIMVDFIEIIANKKLKRSLTLAIAGKGAFTRFKNVLYEYQVERECWFKFKKEKVVDKVLEWLREMEIGIL
ncbi:MAG TPA: UPF0158 family protein [Candidatus Deferrimicrobium sp.]|nr:UPF0158 family protein [Candidatus Deferrimicrobium sp.]